VLAGYIASSVIDRLGLPACLHFFTRADHARRAALEGHLAGTGSTKV
jgi:fructose-specific phosphotransferase system IIC component